MVMVLYWGLGLGLWCCTGDDGYGVVQGVRVRAMVLYRGLGLGLWCCTGG